MILKMHATHFRTCVGLIAVFLARCSPLMAAPPTVGNLSAHQPAGTKTVEVGYDVGHSSPAVAVSIEISPDGGASWVVPAISLSGDHGIGIATGAGKKLVWDAGIDWNEQFSTAVIVRLRAESVAIPEGFAAIPEGVFTRGDVFSEGSPDEQPVRGIFTSGFAMAGTETRKDLWDEVRAWGVANGYTDLGVGASKGPDHPVHSISWYDIVKWCNARSEKEGLVPVYSNGGLVYRSGTLEPACDWLANGYRLPTEAEWEKAARGGTAGKRFPHGDLIDHTVANYFSSALDGYDMSSTRGYHPVHGLGLPPFTSPSGSFAANGFGLYDMAGNVWEWCWDFHAADTYTSGGTVNPRGPATGSSRVLRGGSWGFQAEHARVAGRDDAYIPSAAYDDAGFRPVRALSLTGEFSLATTATISVDTRSVLLVVLPPSGGQGEVSGAGSYAKGTPVSVLASAAPGFLFSHWTGDLTGAINPSNLIMNGPKSIAAVFAPDTTDADGDGLSNHDEIVLHGTDPGVPDTDGDGLEDGTEIALGTGATNRDTDGDGWLDGTEVEFAGNPLVELSGPAFQMTIRPAPAHHGHWLRFPGQPGETYRIETSPRIGDWTTWQAGLSGEGSVIAVLVPTSGAQRRFFRVATEGGFVRIPPGTFLMGDEFDEGDGDELPAHGVGLDAFVIGKFEVTKSEWDRVRGWAVGNGYPDLPAGSAKAPDHPVFAVSWHAVVRWCNARSEMENLQPCYTVGGVVYRTGTATPDCLWSADGYRLPTEAEWEKATRGGAPGLRFPWGDTITHGRANYRATGTEAYDTSPTLSYHPDYDDTPSPFTSRVGSFAPNPFGLTDAVGNIREWCWDWYGAAYYATSPTLNPRGPATGTNRVVRGGSFASPAYECRVSYRDSALPSSTGNNIGFRLARSVPANP